MDEVQKEIESLQSIVSGQDWTEDSSNEGRQLDDISGSNRNDDRAQLNKIFADFNRVASALDESYQVLEKRVSSLKRELSEARRAHQWDQAEKDRLANRLASLVSVLPSAVLVFNRHGIIIDRNQLASNALHEPLIGLTLDQILSREGVNDFSPQNEIRLRDGRIFSIARDELAVSSDTAVFLTDVTDIHQAQQEMARNKRLTEMGEMAASMAHQIRTPLSAAHLYMSPLGRSDIDPQQRSQTLAKVQDRLSHIGKLIDSMLGFVRGSRSVLKTIAVQEILERLSTLVASETEHAQASLVVSQIDPKIFIKADAQALVEALSNIVLNAFEMSRSQPEVQIQVSADHGRFVEIRIIDNGPGISPDKLERIFDPFFTTRSTGTGLGLAIAAMTCKEQGGNIYARNHAGGGAEFVINLPLVEAPGIRVSGSKSLGPKPSEVEPNSSPVDQQTGQSKPKDPLTKRLQREVA